MTGQTTIAGLTKTEFDALNEQHGGHLKPLGVPGLQLIVRPLKRTEYDRLLTELARARDKGESLSVPMANAVRACTVAPGVDELNAAIELRPAVVQTLANKLLELAGAEAEAEELTFL